MSPYPQSRVRGSRVLKAATLALCFVLPMLAVRAFATQSPQNFPVYETPEALPDVEFKDGTGASRTLGDYSGKVVLLNLWATWCVPCRKEMPTLDRLQAKLGGPDFEVVALSIDRAGPEAVRKFFQEIGIERLALNIDPSSKVLLALGAVGLPTTLLIDREGQEIGRLVGPAEWDAAGMVAFIRNYINEN